MSLEEIGGYFHWELLNSYQSTENIVFSSGRSAFAALLKHHNIKLVYLPRYTCDAMLEPIEKLGLSFKFYDLNYNLMPSVQWDSLDDSTAIVVNNYFGLLDSKLKSLPFLANVIIDNSQALYSNIRGGIGAFNSYRKFLGLADGAQAFTSSKELFSSSKRFHCSSSMEYLVGRYEMGSTVFYNSFVKEDLRHTYTEDRSVSLTSEITFNLLDHNMIKSKRQSNYLLFSGSLQGMNELDFSINGEVPLCYPFLPASDGSSLRDYLRKNKIYTPSYWPNKKILPLTNSFEEHLVSNLICLPVDQRYGNAEVSRILELIKRYEK